MSDICEKCGCPDHLTHDMLERDRDEWKRKAEDYVGRWSAMVELEIKLRNDIEALKVDAQPIALQNHELRTALEERHQTWPSELSKRALALTPGRAERIIGAMKTVIQKVRDYGMQRTFGDVLATLDAAEKENA